MAFSSIYKTLFEVRAIHAYYLEDTTHYWSLTSVHDQNQELERLGYDISRDLQFMPSLTSIRTLRDQRMRFTSLPYGFKVGVEVIEKEINGTKRYVPFIPIDDQFQLGFKVRVRNPYFDSISNVRLNPNIRGNYFFSNLTDAISYPSLHPLLPDHNPERKYEMGEMSVTGTACYQALQHTEVAPPASGIWEPITNHQYLNSSDRFLVPARFNYLLTPVSSHLPVTFVEAVLEDNLGTQVAIQQISDTDGLQRVTLNFGEIAPGNYTLKISDDSSTLLDQYSIHLDPVNYGPSDWAMVEIGHRNGLGDFRLLENPDHYLKSNGAELETPVFEIRIGNRLTNWEYIPYEGQVLTPHFDNSSSVELVDGRLFIKSPRGLSHFPQSIAFKEDGTNNQAYFPNPRKPYIQASDTDQYISIIHLPELNINI